MLHALAAKLPQVPAGAIRVVLDEPPGGAFAAFEVCNERPLTDVGIVYGDPVGVALEMLAN